VESYRQGDKTRQRVVLHVGRKDLLAPHLDALVRLLQADQPTPTWVSTEEVSAPQAWTWGPVRVARHLFDSLSPGPILDGTTKLLRRGQPLSERVFPLVANRLTRPGSEHALAQWLEDFYVVTAEGSRWMPQWTASRRVRVSFEQLRLWYETLDDVLAGKPQIETALWRHDSVWRDGAFPSRSTSGRGAASKCGGHRCPIPGTATARRTTRGNAWSALAWTRRSISPIRRELPEGRREHHARRQAAPVASLDQSMAFLARQPVPNRPRW
jgi:hypothetical protein